LAQALGLPKDEAVARSVSSPLRDELANERTRLDLHGVNVEAVQVNSINTARGSADEEFRRRVIAHEKRRTKMAKLMKKKAES